MVASAEAQISGNTPQLRFRELDQALPNGLWRFVLDGNQFKLEKNTAAAGNFSSLLSAATITAAGAWNVPSLTVGTGSCTACLTGMFSTTRGFLPPSMTTTQRDAISTPDAGLIVYNSTTSQPNFYNGSSWGAFGLTGTGTLNAVPRVTQTAPLTYGDSLLFSGVNANTVEQRSGTSGQHFDVYRTYTSATNFEKVTLEGTGSGNFSAYYTILGTYGSAGGSTREIFIGTKDGTGTTRGWHIQTSGHWAPSCIEPSCNNTADLGSRSGDGIHGFIHDVNMQGKVYFGHSAKSISFPGGDDAYLELGETNFTQSATRIAGIRPIAGSGTNRDGQNFTVQAGAGTGTGAGGFIGQITAAGGTASGSTAHTMIYREMSGLGTVLVSGTAKSLFDVALTAGQMTGGIVWYLIESADATDQQEEVGEFRWIAHNKAGTITSACSTPSASNQTSTGTLTIACSAVNQASAITVKITATSTGITPTTLRATYSLKNLGQTQITYPSLF